MDTSAFQSFFGALLIFSLTFINVTSNELKSPAVFVAILVRNKAHSLPYFLSLFSKLEYPKNRISLWIRSDHNEDNSATIVQEWVKAVISDYHSVDLEVGSASKRFRDEDGIAHWSDLRYKHIIELREKSLNLAREKWADYIWLLDCDSFITNPSTLKNLIGHGKTIVAPMLSTDSMYSNFWCGMTSSFYYKRTEDYEKILNRDKIGCFEVPMIHSAVLVDLRVSRTDTLTYSPSKITNYDGPKDDIIAFAIAANRSGIPLFICNDLNYGYTTVPLEENQSFANERDNLLNLKLFISVDESPLPVQNVLSKFVTLPVRSKFGFDEIFVINLKRRKERRERMLYGMRELGIDFSFVEAVDGKTLDEAQLKEMGVSLMKDYEDPYHKRPMKKGEIGCFLSHYKLWKKMIAENYEQILILEDDVRFEKHFLSKFKNLLDELRGPGLRWDLAYLGRKIMNPKNESLVSENSNLVYPDYTYWTLGYIISKQGALKLLDTNPLKKLLPVDEFLPIMFDKHPRDDWKNNFPIRNLIAVSVNPLIIFPIKYTNEEGYVSDTEDSVIIQVEKKIDEL
ncbi:glycosyltransferase 25 family member [Planococcus citri]|uniref:glycosyltransferase 25 family member n=1 Tax=Planococcus citri TaxID=170843 RepID=UPI0031F8A83B